jgi:hypothetical protein
MNEFEDGMILTLTRPVFKAHGAHGICSPGACGTLTPEIFQFSRMLLTSTICEVSPSDGMLVGNSSISRCQDRHHQKHLQVAFITSELYLIVLEKRDTRLWVVRMYEIT